MYYNIYFDKTVSIVSKCSPIFSISFISILSIFSSKIIIILLIQSLSISLLASLDI